MKFIVLFFCLFSLSCFGNHFSTPIWEEDPHFVYYRMFQVQGNVNMAYKYLIFIKKHKDDPTAVLELANKALLLCENAMNAMGYIEYLQEDVEVNGL